MGDLTCPAPSLQPHYRAFIATTSWSASVPRIGTLPTWPWPPGVLPLDGQGADVTHFDWPFVSRRQILLFHARACNELTPPLHRTPPGPRAGSSLAPDPPRGAPLSRGRRAAPVSMSSFTFSMRQQWFTHVRLLVAHLTR